MVLKRQQVLVCVYQTSNFSAVGGHWIITNKTSQLSSG